jgi:hypothetical protein
LSAADDDTVRHVLSLVPLLTPASPFNGHVLLVAVAVQVKSVRTFIVLVSLSFVNICLPSGGSVVNPDDVVVVQVFVGEEKVKER